MSRVVQWGIESETWNYMESMMQLRDGRVREMCGWSQLYLYYTVLSFREL